MKLPEPPDICCPICRLPAQLIKNVFVVISWQKLCEPILSVLRDAKSPVAITGFKPKLAVSSRLRLWGYTQTHLRIVFQ